MFGVGITQARVSAGAKNNRAHYHPNHHLEGYRSGKSTGLVPSTKTGRRTPTSTSQDRNMSRVRTRAQLAPCGDPHSAVYLYRNICHRPTEPANVDTLRAIIHSTLTTFVTCGPGGLVNGHAGEWKCHECTGCLDRAACCTSV